MPRLRFLFPVMLLTLGTAASCSKDKEDPTPAVAITAVSKTQLVGTWRLDDVYTAGTLTASGAAIKDRYTIQFRADDTYTQTLLADGTVYAGTWKLDDASSLLLHLTDHKGDPQDYAISSVSDKALRYSRLNKDGQTVELRFTNVP